MIQMENSAFQLAWLLSYSFKMWCEEVRQWANTLSHIHHYNYMKFLLTCLMKLSIAKRSSITSQQSGERRCLPSKSIIANQQQSGPMKEQHLIVRLLIRIEMQQDSTSKHTNNNKPRCYNFIAWQRLAVKQLKCHDQYAIISLTLTLWEKWLNVHL